MNIDKAGYCIFMRFYMFSLYVLFVFLSGAAYCMYVFISIAATKRNKILIDFIIFSNHIYTPIYFTDVYCKAARGWGVWVRHFLWVSVKTCNKYLSAQAKFYKLPCVVMQLYL